MLIFTILICALLMIWAVSATTSAAAARVREGAWVRLAIAALALGAPVVYALFLAGN